MITYTEAADNVRAQQLTGFFEGWPNPPGPEIHMRLLRSSHHVVLAWDAERVVGFVTALSDGVLSAYIPLLEVLPAYRGLGIGRELVRRMLERLANLYMVDLLCDAGVQPFYERLGMQRAHGMMLRHFEHQDGS